MKMYNNEKFALQTSHCCGEGRPGFLHNQRCMTEWYSGYSRKNLAIVSGLSQ